MAAPVPEIMDTTSYVAVQFGKVIDTQIEFKGLII
jgi:hypothetical protein